MADSIQFRRGIRSAVSPLPVAMPGYIEDEQRLIIGNGDGTNAELPNKADIDNISSRMADNVNLLEMIAFNPKRYGAIGDNTFHSIKDVDPSITLDEVQSLNQNATLNNSIDWYAMQKAIKNYKHIQIPAGYYILDLPLYKDADMSINAGKCTIEGVSERDVIFYGQFDSPDEGLFNYKNENGQSSWGIELKNIYFVGNNHKLHALSFKNINRVYIHKCSIENFDGAGILGDKIQDSLFDFFEIYGCGRTSGDRSNIDDLTDNSKTLYSPIHLISTIENDSPNMVRFNNGMLQANKVSPYIHVEGDPSHSPLGIFFNDLHGEYFIPTYANKFDLFDLNICEAKLTGITSTGFRKTLIQNAGQVSLSDNIFKLNEIEVSNNGVLFLSNSNVTKITSTSPYIYTNNCIIQTKNIEGINITGTTNYIKNSNFNNASPTTVPDNWSMTTNLLDSSQESNSGILIIGNKSTAPAWIKQSSITVKPNTIYSIVYGISKEANVKTSKILLEIKDSNDSIIKSIYIDPEWSPSLIRNLYTFLTPNNAVSLNFAIQHDGSTSASANYRIILEKPCLIEGNKQVDWASNIED